MTIEYVLLLPRSSQSWPRRLQGVLHLGEVRPGFMGPFSCSLATMGAGTTAGHAFISYVHEDSLEVDRLQSVLESGGIRVWRDTVDLGPGQVWQDRIREAITGDALVFIACFSRNSVARGRNYQNEEFTLAVDEFRLRPPDVPWLIPVRFDECEIPERNLGGGLTLNSIQRVDLFGDHYDQAASKLAKGVQDIL